MESLGNNPLNSEALHNEIEDDILQEAAVLVWSRSKFPELLLASPLSKHVRRITLVK
jgi:hypothetical protein